MSVIDQTQCASGGLFLLPVSEAKRFKMRVVNSLDL